MLRRNTVQKRTIYSALCRLANHPSADMVYEEVKGESPNISRSTVYRVLNQMAEAGTVGKVLVLGAADRFDHRTDSHSHIRCVRCGRVEDVETGGTDDLVDRVEAPGGFRVCGCDLIFKGICPDCLEKEA